MNRITEQFMWCQGFYEALWNKPCLIRFKDGNVYLEEGVYASKGGFNV